MVLWLQALAAGAEPTIEMIRTRQAFSEDEARALSQAQRALSKMDGVVVGDAASYTDSRFLDFFDIHSIELGAGFGIKPHIQITRWIQLGLGYRLHGRSAGFISPFWEWKRQWGFYAENGGEIAIGPYSYEACNRKGRWASMEPYKFKKNGVNRPDEPIYQSQRDFWAVTLGGGILILLPIPLLGVDGSIEFHPVEFADFFAGFVGSDICHDDLGKGWGWRGKAASEKRLQTIKPGPYVKVNR
jgi:hypothetical protein